LPRDVPFVVAMTESDVNRLPALRREDSDEPGDRFRLSGIAGSCHAGPFAAGLPSAAELALAGFEPPARALGREAAGDFPWRLAFNALWEKYAQWLEAGLRMPTPPRIQPDRAHQPLRDAGGNAGGGWRRPQIQAPLAAYPGGGTPRDDTDRARVACSLTGVQ